MFDLVVLIVRAEEIRNLWSSDHSGTLMTSMYAGKIWVPRLWRGWENLGLALYVYMYVVPLSSLPPFSSALAHSGGLITSLYAGKSWVPRLLRGWENFGFERKNHDSRALISKKRV